MAVVFVLHALLLAAAWFARVELPHHDEEAMTAAILSDPAPVIEDKPRAPLPVRLVAPVPVPVPVPMPMPMPMPMPAVIVDNVPAIEVPAVEAAPTPSQSVQIAASAPSAAAPETLSNELAVQCPERTPPRYPLLAKRQREQGEVRLRVELDESGRIDHVTIVSSSGSARLDEAARAAIESWRCRPAERGGQRVRAVALQSLDFVLERR